VDHTPLGVEPGVAHERDERVEDLGHPASESGRGKMQHALAGERLCERPQLFHEATARDRRVVGKGLVADVYLLQLHGGGGYRRLRRIN
jgi:hypothetical protein